MESQKDPLPYLRNLNLNCYTKFNYLSVKKGNKSLSLMINELAIDTT